MFVSDADRHKRHVEQARTQNRFDHVIKQPETRRQQLAGSRTRTLERPKQRKALVDQVVDVAPEGRLVNFVVLKRASQKDDARATRERAQSGGVQINAAERQGQRQVGVKQHDGQRDRIEHRFVAGQEHDRPRSKQSRYMFQLLRVDIDLGIVVAACSRAV